jgi:Spy/CpxP family protein refolding chaperone
MIRRVLIAAVLTALVASLGYAQRGGGGGGGGGGMGGGGGQMGGGMGRGGGRGPQVDKSDILVELLKLTPEQKTAIDAIMDAAQKQANPILPQMEADRKEMLEAAAQGHDIDEMTKKLADLNTQMLGIEVDAFSQALAKLDAKQKSKAAQFFGVMAGMFAAPGGWHRSN